MIAFLYSFQRAEIYMNLEEEEVHVRLPLQDKQDDHLPDKLDLPFEKFENARFRSNEVLEPCSDDLMTVSDLQSETNEALDLAKVLDPFEQLEKEFQNHLANIRPPSAFDSHCSQISRRNSEVDRQSNGQILRRDSEIDRQNSMRNSEFECKLPNLSKNLLSGATESDLDYLETNCYSEPVNENDDANNKGRNNLNSSILLSHHQLFKLQSIIKFQNLWNISCENHQTFTYGIL